MKKLTIILAGILAVLLIFLAGLLLSNPKPEAASPPQIDAPTQETPLAPTETTAPARETSPPEDTVTEPTPTEPAFAPKCTDKTDPANWNMEWKILVGEQEVDSYKRQEPIFFEDNNYFALPGVAAFRGNNHRTNSSYGTAQITEATIEPLWRQSVGFIDTADWIGCGWTGQPLVAQWDAQTRAIMNLYPEKQQKEGLVEAIYPKLDGYIHFIDMEDGSATRDPLYIGMVFKGSGALDPRGYPIAYLGAGLPQGGKLQSIFAVSLIDGSILYEMSGYNELAPRYWCGFDSNPLIDAETDTLIWAGENGLIYTIKLNTQYDKEAGTISLSPDEAVMAAGRSDYTRGVRHSGYEASITAVENYLFLGDNSGLLQCVDLNTMELIWVQDLHDDINATPLFDWGYDGRGYLYVGPSVDYNGGAVSIYKIDAQTGSILWTYDAQCSADAQYPGGVMGSPILGQAGTNMEDIIIIPLGRTPDYWSAQVIAFHRQSGQILWQHETNSNIWSSPIALYTEDGRGYVFQVDISGTCYLLDGQTGEELYVYKLKRTVESTPVAFGNRILLGTRAAMELFEIK